MMRRLAIVCGFLLATGFSVAGQEMPKVELFAGYTYARVYNTNGDHSTANGGTASVAFFPSKWLGLVGDFGGSSSGGFTNPAGVFTSTSGDSIHFFGGPRLRFGNEHFTPYVQVLIGGVHRSTVTNSSGTVLSNPETSFAYAVNGGFDVKVAHHFSIRLIQAGYLHTAFTPLAGTQNSQNDLTIATGIVIH